MGFWYWFHFGIKTVIKNYKKVIKIWDLGMSFFLGSRLQESDQDFIFWY